MKARTIIACMLAGTALFSCSKQEQGVANLNGNGDAYVSFSVVASNSTRATDGGFANGTDVENAVKTLKFYFYDAAGNHMDLTQKTEELSYSSSANTHIEKIVDAIVVLENPAVLPSTVLVVANDALSAEEYATLTTAKAAIANSYANKINSTDYFVMTNSTAATNTCEVKLTNANLAASADLAKHNPVKVNIERLAAKVECVTAGATITPVADVSVDQTPATLNITVLGWGLNATNKSEYMLKKVNSAWTFDWWKDATDNCRSYWAIDPNYADGNYPNSYADLKTKLGESTTYEPSLNYNSYNTLKNAANTYEYCLENTMDATLAGSFMTTATSVLVLAQATVEGQTAQDLFKYKGIFYTAENYKAAVLDEFYANGGDVYVRVNEGEATVSRPVNNDEVKIVNKLDGKVAVELEEGTTYYDINDTALTPEQIAAANKLLAATTTYGFKNGMMYYNVPVEHYAGFGADNKTVSEGTYGIVRNHWYKVTISSIANLGTSVWDPDEPIVPNYNPDDYYLAAEINILSWHIVSQTVNL